MSVATAAAGPALWSGRQVMAREASGAAEMLVHTAVPPNAEPRLASLVENWITPVDRFYVRSHAPTPKIDPATYRLSISGLVKKPFEISLDALKAEFPQATTVATLTCAGNRRSEHSLVKPIKGVPWQSGAIGNARWGGARLADLLRRAGVKPEAKHVWFEGLDRVSRNTAERDSGVIPFGASIPIDKAMANHNGTPGALVVYEQNGQPLTPDHGFPVRTVVPGYIGARSVKWLGRIVVSDRPSPNHYVATAYKLVEEGAPEEWSAAAPLETFVINSVTCVPADGANVAAGKLAVRGYALPPGLPGRTVARVEVSTDGGQRWTPARFDRAAKPFCWRLWSAEVPVTRETREIIVRAIDSTGVAQPETVAWNLKGYNFNAWHKTPIAIR